MHYIQKHILDVLRATESTRYAKLMTDEIESGHFRYHLTQLVKDGYVSQLKRGLYGLTTKGQQYVDKLSERKVVADKMPKVITYTLLVDGDNILLQEKHKQPYMRLLNMIGGKLHEGETSSEASVREVYEKTGSKIKSSKLSGVFEIIINTEEHLLTHAIAYVFTAEVKIADFDKKSVEVVQRKDLFKTPNLAPDFLAIYNKISKSTGTYFGLVKLKL